MFNRWPTFQRAVYLGQLEINTSTQRLPSAEIQTLTDRPSYPRYLRSDTDGNNSTRFKARRFFSHLTVLSASACWCNTQQHEHISQSPSWITVRRRQSYHRDLVWILRQILWCLCPHVSPVIEIRGRDNLELFSFLNYIPTLLFSKNTYRYGMFLGAG
jgi:hypothetical protein